MISLHILEWNQTRYEGELMAIVTTSHFALTLEIHSQHQMLSPPLHNHSDLTVGRVQFQLAFFSFFFLFLYACLMTQFCPSPIIPNFPTLDNRKTLSN